MKKEGKPTSQPAYDVSAAVNIVIGVNNMKVTEAVKNPDLVYQAAEVEQVPIDEWNYVGSSKHGERLLFLGSVPVG